MGSRIQFVVYDKYMYSVYIHTQMHTATNLQTLFNLTKKKKEKKN